ncbi:20119_t:CDS:1, partial [Funneliformis geosporum]
EQTRKRYIKRIDKYKRVDFLVKVDHIQPLTFFNSAKSTGTSILNGALSSIFSFVKCKYVFRHFLEPTLTAM